MKRPGHGFYEDEREAIQQAPQDFLRHQGEQRLVTALLADPWYVWPVLIALTSAWVANAAFQWPVSGVSAFLEIGALAGLAACLVAPRTGSTRAPLIYAALFCLWGIIGGIGTPTRLLPQLVGWLVGGLVFAAISLVVARTVRVPFGWLVVIASVLPWLQGREVSWGIALAQSVLALVAGGAALVVASRANGTHPVWLWLVITLIAWIIIAAHPAGSDSMTTLAPAVVGLIAVFAGERWLRHQRAFVVVVALWAALHVLGLRSGEGSLVVRLALIVPGFLLLVVAGWRFGEASLLRWPRSMFRSSPLCIVPRLDQSRDHPLVIHVR